MKYKSEIFEVIHQDAVEMHKIGGITETRMREYDEMCLVNPKLVQKSTPSYNNKNLVNLDHASPIIA